MSSMYWNLVIVKELLFYLAILLTHLLSWTLAWAAIFWFASLGIGR